MYFLTAFAMLYGLFSIISKKMSSQAAEDVFFAIFLVILVTISFLLCLYTGLIYVLSGW